MRPSCDRTGDLQEEGHSPAADTEKRPSPETKSLTPICYLKTCEKVNNSSLLCLTAAHVAPKPTLQGRKQGAERWQTSAHTPTYGWNPKITWFLFSTFSLFLMSLQSFSAFWFIFFFFFLVVLRVDKHR